MSTRLSPSVLEALTRARLRPTRSRVALIDVLSKAQAPLATSDLIERARALRVPASTVYRTLVSLESAGIVRRLDFGEDFARYEIAEELGGGHHHHFVCRNCGRVDDLDQEPRIEKALERLAESLELAGREIDSHRLDIVGTCATCAGR